MNPTIIITRTLHDLRSRHVTEAEVAALIVENLEAYGYDIVDTIPASTPSAEVAA